MTAWWRWPVHWAQVFSGAKDFRGNPVLGSERLNRWGLHRARARWAQTLADARRWLMSPWVHAQDREAYRQQGYVRLDNFLTESDWQQLARELSDLKTHAIEMHQPPATTRRFNLDDATCTPLPVLHGLIRNRRLLWSLRYVAGYWGTPITAIQVIHTDAAQTEGQYDPQTEWHTDTFHSTAKAWFFVHPVQAHEGPLSYLPGSHRRTPQRLEWEYEQSQRAAQHPNLLHSRGSFRLSSEDLAELGYPAPILGTTRGNTLMVADTSGVHRRTPSQQPSVRVEVYFSLRRNPFWAGLYPSLLGLPLMRRYWAGWALNIYRWMFRLGRPGWIPALEPGLRAEELARINRGEHHQSEDKIVGLPCAENRDRRH